MANEAMKRLVMVCSRWKRRMAVMTSTLPVVETLRRQKTLSDIQTNQGMFQTHRKQWPEPGETLKCPGPRIVHCCTPMTFPDSW